MTIDKTNNYGYLSPYMKDLSGIDGAQTDFGTVVRFSTENYVSNTTNIKAIDLPTNYNTAEIPGSKLTGFMGIKEHNSSVYLAPNKHSVFIRINTTRKYCNCY